MLPQPTHARLCRSGMGTVIRAVAETRVRMGRGALRAAAGASRVNNHCAEPLSAETVCETGMGILCEFLIAETD